MDISAAKDVINMYIEMINKEMAEENRTAAMQAVSEAEALLRLLPDFMYDESGAVKEWSMKEYGENNAHRHISHLYPAWPALQTQHDSKLAAACRQAVINRNHENKGKDDTASHGWIHKALVEARLKNADAVYDTLNLLVHSDIFYTTLFTDHNTDRSKGVYCTDTAFGLVGIINEMLVYSDEHTIELLPAWSDKLGSGMVKGLRTRCGITIDELKWDVDKKKVYVSLDWGNADEINIVCGKYEIEKSDMKGRADDNYNFMLYREGREVSYASQGEKHNDINEGKWIGVGGHAENQETPEECLVREVKEETGLTLTSYRFRGLVTFISNECEPELMCVFTADGFTGELIECDEGELAWVDKEEVPELPTWEGDRVFLNLLLSGEERFFSIKLKYEGSRLMEKQVNLY